MDHLIRYGRRTFASFSIYNFRLYMAGQSLSLIGTWIQVVAQSWLVLQLTGSATMLGLSVAAQFLPILLFGAYGGVITDRFNKRSLLLITQSAFLVLTLLMAVLIDRDAITIGLVFALSLITGFVSVVDNPARQTFMLEMVGARHLRNAVSLNSIVVNLMRVIGPALGALLIARAGLAECFYVNAFSFGAVVICLLLMRRRELHPGKRSKQLRGQLAAGLRYVRRTPILLDVLVMMALVGTMAYEFPVVLPVLASVTFGSDASGYAWLMGAFSAGAVLGGLVIAARKGLAFQAFAVSSLVFGVFMAVMAAMPTLWTAMLAALPVGFASVAFMSLGNTILQLQADPTMRGRVMSLWTVAFLGSTPIGGPIIGWISQQYGPRYGVAAGAIACVLAGLYGLVRLQSAHRTSPASLHRI